MHLPRVASLLSLGVVVAGSSSCSVADLTSATPHGDAGEAGEASGEMLESGAGALDAGVDVTWDASSWQGPAGAVRVRNALTGKYLNAPLPPVDASTFTPGVPVVTWSYTGATNQCWTFQYLKEDDSYELLTDTGRCLDDPDGSADDGTSMQQYQCWLGANDNQRWYLVNDQGHLNVVGKASGKCLTSMSEEDGVDAYISDCSTSESVQWVLSNCP